MSVWMVQGQENQSIVISDFAMFETAEEAAKTQSKPIGLIITNKPYHGAFVQELNIIKIYRDGAWHDIKPGLDWPEAWASIDKQENSLCH